MIRISVFAIAACLYATPALAQPRGSELTDLATECANGNRASCNAVEDYKRKEMRRERAQAARESHPRTPLWYIALPFLLLVLVVIAPVFWKDSGSANDNERRRAIFSCIAVLSIVLGFWVFLSIVFDNRPAPEFASGLVEAGVIVVVNVVGAIAGAIALARDERWFPISRAHRSAIWISFGVLAAVLAVVIVGGGLALEFDRCGWDGWGWTLRRCSPVQSWLFWVAAIPAYFLLQYFAEAVLEGFWDASSRIVKDTPILSIVLLYALAYAVYFTVVALAAPVPL